MALRSLIEKQVITIDDHTRGCDKINNWDDSSIDVHLDKKTKYRIQGKYVEVRIKIPINSDRDITIKKNGREIESIPQKISKEIEGAFRDKKIRDSFVKDLVDVLRTFASALTSKEKATAALTRIAQHFDLKPEMLIRSIPEYSGEGLNKLSLKYKTKSGESFYAEIQKDKMSFGEKDGMND